MLELFLQFVQIQIQYQTSLNHWEHSMHSMNPDMTLTDRFLKLLVTRLWNKSKINFSETFHYRLLMEILWMAKSENPNLIIY